MLTVTIDFKSPASWLALEPTLELARETGVPIDWLPFQVKPFTIPEQQEHETAGERHRRVRAEAQRDTWQHYAAVQGREMDFPLTPFGSEKALAAMATIEGDPVPFIRTAFAAYWEERANLDDETVVARLLSSVGIVAPDPGTANERLHALRLRAEELGIFESPSYVIAGQLFVGREHLPWIRSLIDGAKVG